MNQFYSASGQYNVEFEGDHENEAEQIVFRVKANPNGSGYADNGSAVTGCYNPTLAVSEIFEYTAKKRTATDGKGDGRTYKAC